MVVPVEQERTTIVIVEDDPNVRGMLTEFLTLRGHAVHSSELGAAGAELAAKLKPSLVILDVQLPDMDGLSVCRLLKADRRTRPIPILILTSQNTTENRLKAVEYAADHFLAKPILDLEEFHTWVRALLRRGADAAPERLAVGGALVLDDEESTAAVSGGTPHQLPPKLFSLLAELVRRPGEVVSREYLIAKVWNNAVRDREVDVAVRRLRMALGPAQAIVASVPGRGYRLDTVALARLASR